MTRKTTKLEEAICDRCGVMVVNPDKNWSVMEVWDRKDGEYVDPALTFRNKDKAPADLCPDCRWNLQSWFHAIRDATK